MFLLLNVKKQSYYKWIKNDCRLFNKWNESIANAIKEVYYSNPYYGYKTIADKLKNTENKANKNTVYRYMKAMDLKGITRKRVAYKYPIKPGLTKLPNLLLENGVRNFTSTKSNTKWSVDITYLRKKHNPLYLFAVKDLYDKRIVAHSVSNKYSVSFVLEALNKAFKDNSYKDLIIHSDQGFQFTSDEYVNYCLNKNIKVSYSRRGNSLDNAPIESFFSTFKFENTITRYEHMSNSEVSLDIDKYIHFYNNIRISTKLKGMTPIEYGNHS